MCCCTSVEPSGLSSQDFESFPLQNFLECVSLKAVFVYLVHPKNFFAFNSGVGEEDTEFWQLLIARGILTYFTAYNQLEAEHAQATLEKLARCIVQPAAANPFRSEVPFVEPVL